MYINKLIRKYLKSAYLPKLHIETEQQAPRTVTRDRADRCVGETQAGSALVRKDVRGLEKVIRARYEFQFIRIQKDATHSCCRCKIAAHHKNCSDFQENVLEQQPFSPAVGQELVHHRPRKGMLRIPLVMEGYEKTRVQNNH